MFGHTEASNSSTPWALTAPSPRKACTVSRAAWGLRAALNKAP
jgi:hypothetical protein